MSEKITVNWLDGMAFEAEVNQHILIMDAHEGVGGKDRGPRPKPLLLASLAGCTGMDVVSILDKMRVQTKGFRIDIEANLSEEHPKVYTDIRLIYIFSGNDLPFDKLQKAVELSQEKYCGVSAMLKQSAKLEYEIRVE